MGGSLKLGFSCLPPFHVPGDLSFLLNISAMHLKECLLHFIIHRQAFCCCCFFINSGVFPKVGQVTRK